MAKNKMDELLKKRMTATQQASELEVGNEAYEKLFQAKSAAVSTRFGEVLIDQLRPFFTADIGFHPYPSEKPQLLFRGWFQGCRFVHSFP